MTNQWSYQDILIDEQSIENANNFIEFIEEYRSIEKLFDIKKEHQVLIYSSNETLQNLFIENQEVFEFLTRKNLSLNPLTQSVSLPFKKFDYEIETDQTNKLKIKKRIQIAIDSPAAAGADAGEEQSDFTVVLKDTGAQKIAVIKVIKEVLGLGLKEAKDIVDAAPSDVKTGVKKEEGEEIKKKLEEAGATVELK